MKLRYLDHIRSQMTLSTWLYYHNVEIIGTWVSLYTRGFPLPLLPCSLLRKQRHRL